MKTTSCTEKTRFAFDSAPRCGASTKRNKGLPCKAPALKEKNRCRMHGGARGSGGPRDNRNALTHGETTIKKKLFRKAVRQMISESKALLSRYNE